GEVIIGAEVQTLDAILDRIARAQNDDRLIEAAAAPLPQELQPFAVREAEIEHDGVEARLAERVACRGAGGGERDAVTGLREPLLEQEPELAIVLDDQDFHIGFRLRPHTAGRSRSEGQVSGTS